MDYLEGFDAAVFSGINGILGHTSEKSGFARKTRYEVVFYQPKGVEWPTFDSGPGFQDLRKPKGLPVDTSGGIGGSLGGLSGTDISLGRTKGLDVSGVDVTGKLNPLPTPNVNAKGNIFGGSIGSGNIGTGFGGFGSRGKNNKNPFAQDLDTNMKKSFTKGGNEELKSLTLRANSATIPGRALTLVEDKISQPGSNRAIVSGMDYGEFTVSFYCGEKLEEKLFFEKWQNAAYNNNTNNCSYYDDYVGTVEFFHLNEKDERTYGATFFEVYPKSVSDLQYSYADVNLVHTISIQFQYRFWKTLGDVNAEKLINSTNGLVSGLLDMQETAKETLKSKIPQPTDLLPGNINIF